MVTIDGPYIKPFDRNERLDLNVKSHGNFGEYEKNRRRFPKAVKYLEKNFEGLPVLMLNIGFDRESSLALANELANKEESIKKIEKKWEKLEKASKSPWVKFQGDRELYPHYEIGNILSERSRKRLVPNNILDCYQSLSRCAPALETTLDLSYLSRGNDDVENIKFRNPLDSPTHGVFFNIYPMTGEQSVRFMYND